MCTIKQHQGEEAIFFLSILFNCEHFVMMSMNSDSLEPTVPKAFCSLLKSD